MSFLHRLRVRMTSLRPGALAVRDGDHDEELETFQSMLIEDNVRAGMSRSDAARAARLETGGVSRLKEQVRQASFDYPFHTLVSDVRYALRCLLARPAFTTAIVVTLALGIGANTAVFSIVNALMLEAPAAIQDADRLVDISRGAGDEFRDMSYPAIDHLRRHSRTVTDLAAVSSPRVALGGQSAAGQRGGEDSAADDRPRRNLLEVVWCLAVTGNYFDVLGVRPALGRTFAPDESFVPAVSDSVVISHRLWQRRFGGDADVIGRTVAVNGTPLVIIGVAARGFGGHTVGLHRDVYVLLGTSIPGLPSAASLMNPREADLAAIGRLAPGASVSAARSELSALAGEYSRQQSLDRVYHVRAQPYSAFPSVGRSAGAAFFSVLMVVVALLLAIACVTVTNMLLARAAERRREIAIRLALGAARARILRQLLTETLVLFGLGAIVGVGLATWLTTLLSNVTPVAGVRIEADLAPDVSVVLFAVAVTVVAALASGLAPAWRATRADLVSAIKGDRSDPSRPRARLRQLLIAGQMGATLVLLVCAGLFLRALQSAQTTDLGFTTDDVQTAQFDLEISGKGVEGALAFYDELTAILRGLPGVEHVALAHKLPLASRSTFSGFNAAGVEPPNEDGFSFDYLVVDGDYFDVVGIPIRAGTDLANVTTDDGRAVAVINETLAGRLWPGEPAVGKTLFRGPVGEGTPYHVIGVAKDARYHGLVGDTPSFIYLPFAHQARTKWSSMNVLIKSAPDRALPEATIRQAVARADRHVPVLSVAPLAAEVGRFFILQRLAALFTGAMGIIGVVLGAVGVYGVTSHSVSQRRHEIGIRMALGARASDILRLIMVGGMVFPLIGLLAGLAVALIVTRFLASFLVGVSPLDPVTFGAVLGMLTGIALLANYTPAARAARVDPAVTLRAE